MHTQDHLHYVICKKGMGHERESDGARSSAPSTGSSGSAIISISLSDGPLHSGLSSGEHRYISVARTEQFCRINGLQNLSRTFKSMVDLLSDKCHLDLFL